MNEFACSIQALIACLSWSGFYIDGGAAWQDRGELRVTQIGTYDPEPFDGIQDTRVYYFGTYEADNPYVDIGLGYSIQPTRTFELNLRVAAHKSSVDTGKDWGFNYARIGFEWRPFRR